MTAESIPQPLIILGDEFRLMANRLTTRMTENPYGADALTDIFDLVDQHLSLLTNHVDEFANQVNDGLGRLNYESHEYFRAAAGRLDAELDGILDGYDDLRRLQPTHDDFEGWSLLVEIYDETLYQIHDWLMEVVEFVDDPAAGLRKRGVPTDGSGAVNLSLNMKPPRELNRLTRWLERRSHHMSAAQHAAWAQEDRRRAHRTGMVLGSLIGLWMGKG